MPDELLLYDEDGTTTLIEVSNLEVFIFSALDKM